MGSYILVIDGFDDVGLVGGGTAPALINSGDGATLTENNCTPGDGFVILSMAYLDAGDVGDGVVVFLSQLYSPYNPVYVV
jgi:hypothetical protein